MKTPGVIRKIDDLGRIVIPQEIRRAMQLQGGDSVELCLDGERLVLHKYAVSCVFCGQREALHEYQGKYLCQHCLQKLRKV